MSTQRPTASPENASYSFLNIDPPGAAAVSVGAMNQNSKVAGTYATDAGWEQQHGFVYDDGTFTTFDVPNATGISCHGINDEGEVVGTCSGTQGSAAIRSFIFNKGTVTDFRIPGSAITYATGIDDAGDIVGSYSEPLPNATGGLEHGFISHGGTLETIDVPGASGTFISHVSDNGKILGTAMFGGVGEPFIYSEGTITLPALSDSMAHADAVAINDSGQIAGTRTSAYRNIVVTGFVYEQGNTTPVQVQDFAYTNIVGMNNNGDVAGMYGKDASQVSPYVYHNGTAQPLDTLGNLRMIPSQINDAGTLVGTYGTSPNVHAFIAARDTSDPLFQLNIQDLSNSQPVMSAARAYSGPVAGLQNEYAAISADNLYIVASSDNWFIRGGSGQNSIVAHGGFNVLDGGSGSSIMQGGTATNAFYLDDRHPAVDIWSTIVNFHTGDTATLWGVTPADFSYLWRDDEGAAGFQGLTLHVSAPGRPTASLTLTGYTQADLSGGRLSEAVGTEPVSGTPYLLIHANG